MLEMFPQDADRRRIVELCGMDPDAILAERDARPVNPPGVAPKLQESLELAGDDAFRLGQSDIRDENLLFGLLRCGGLPLMYFTKVSRMDLDRFRPDVAARIRPGEDRVDRPKLPLHSDAQATIQAAIAIATERRRTEVHGLHLLYALTRADHGAVADLLARYGSSAASLNAEMQSAL
jgi:ATP-dependent Clp protease ATP-binding subunit ClpA